MSAATRRSDRRRLPDPKACQRLAEQMLALTLKAGADGAEVLVRDGTELEVKVRLGEPELVKEAGSRGARACACSATRARRSPTRRTSRRRRWSGSRARRSSWRALAEPDPS